MKRPSNLVDVPALVPTAPTSLHTFKLLLLKGILICSSGAIVLIWIFESLSDRVSPIDQIAYPLIISIFSISCVFLFVRPDTLEWVERLSFATFAAYIVLSAQPTMHMDTEAYKIASLAQWFPLVYTTAFFFLTTRQATVVSGFVYIAILVPCYVDLRFHDQAWWASERGLLLINMFCSHPVYIVTLSGIARLKTHVLQARAHANVLHIAASVDYLTGVANRRTITHVLEHALDQAHERRQAVSVILFDIDHFKRINDTFGHDVGDNVLIQVASILREHLRPSDTLGRWGGEEFVIVAGATDAIGAACLAERLRVLVANYTFERAGQLTASFGVAISLPHESADMLVKRADEALYEAKQHGRNRVEVVSEAIAP